MDEENLKLSATETKLLVRCRLDMEAEFASGKKKKSVLWGKVLASMNIDAPDFSITRDQLQRKFLNMLATYKRIRKRNKSTGRDATTWEYFNEFDEVYGTRHSISPPPQNLLSSLESPSSHSVQDDGECQGENHNSDIDSDGESARSSKNNEKENYENVCSRKRKIPGNELLEFFKKEASEEKRRHNEVMNLEKEKLKIEQEKVTRMMELRDVLDKFVSK